LEVESPFEDYPLIDIPPDYEFALAEECGMNLS